MFKRSTYKALTISVLLYLILIIGLFNVYLHSSEVDNRFSVEYYVEEKIPEIVENQQEEDLSAKEKLETHRSYNEAQEQAAKVSKNMKTSSKEFEEYMKAMDQAIKESADHGQHPKETPINTDTDIAKVIHNQNVHKQSSIRYSLANRTAINLPNPVYTCYSYGTIVIQITVDKIGKVINTSVDNFNSTSSDKCLKDKALEYANQARFNVSESSDEYQTGTITYSFIGS